MAILRQLRPRTLIARRFRGRSLQSVPVGCPIYLALVCEIPPKAPPLKCDVGCWQSFANHNQVRNIGIFGVSSDDVVNETGLMVFRKRGESVVDATKENWVGTLCRGPIRHTWWRWHKVCLYFFVADSKPYIELLSLIREQRNRHRIRLDLSAQLRLSFKRLPKMLNSLRLGYECTTVYRHIRGYGMTNIVEDKRDTHRQVSIIMKRDRRLDLRFSPYPRPVSNLKSLSHCPKLAVKYEGAPKGSPCNHERQCGYCPICRLGFFVWSIPVVAQPIQDDNHDLGPRWRAFGAVSLAFWCVGELIVWRSIHIMDELEISNNVTQQFGIVD